MYSGMFAMVTYARLISRVNFFNSLLETSVLWNMLICPEVEGMLCLACEAEFVGLGAAVQMVDWGWCSLYHRVCLHIGPGFHCLIELLEIKELPTIP
jgi:hypothetical protein